MPTCISVLWTWVTWLEYGSNCPNKPFASINKLCKMEWTQCSRRTNCIYLKVPDLSKISMSIELRLKMAKKIVVWSSSIMKNAKDQILTVCHHLVYKDDWIKTTITFLKKIQNSTWKRSMKVLKCKLLKFSSSWVSRIDHSTFLTKQSSRTKMLSISISITRTVSTTWETSFLKRKKTTKKLNYATKVHWSRSMRSRATRCTRE